MSTSYAKRKVTESGKCGSETTWKTSTSVALIKLARLLCGTKVLTFQVHCRFRKKIVLLNDFTQSDTVYWLTWPITTCIISFNPLSPNYNYVEDSWSTLSLSLGHLFRCRHFSRMPIEDDLENINTYWRNIVESRGWEQDNIKQHTAVEGDRRHSRISQVNTIKVIVGKLFLLSYIKDLASIGLYIFKQSLLVLNVSLIVF